MNQRGRRLSPYRVVYAGKDVASITYAGEQNGRWISTNTGRSIPPVRRPARRV